MLKDYSDMEIRIDKQLKKFHNVQSLMQYINEGNLWLEHARQDGKKATGVNNIIEYCPLVKPEISYRLW